MADFDLSELARNAGLSGRVELGLIEPTLAQKRELERIAAAVVIAWRREIAETVLPAYAAAIGRREGALGLALALDVDALERSLTEAAERVARTASGTEAALAVYVSAVARWHTARWIEEIRRATRVNVSPLISEIDLRALIDGAVRRNVALIKGLDGDIAARVERAVWDAWNENRSASVLRGQLRKNLAFAPARIDLIATDQVNKLAGEMDRLRFLQAGLDTYIWVTRGDDRVRPSHRSKNGRVFRWDRPPADTGHPGNDIRCRCRARAEIKGQRGA